MKTRELNESQSRIVYLKCVNGFTFEEFAKITGVKQNTLQQYCIGRRTPSEAIMFMIETKVKDWQKKHTITYER